MMAQLAAWAVILVTAAAFLFTMTGCGDSREVKHDMPRKHG